MRRVVCGWLQGVAWQSSRGVLSLTSYYPCVTSLWRDLVNSASKGSSVCPRGGSDWRDLRKLKLKLEMQVAFPCDDMGMSSFWRLEGLVIVIAMTGRTDLDCIAGSRVGRDRYNVARNSSARHGSARALAWWGNGMKGGYFHLARKYQVRYLSLWYFGYQTITRLRSITITSQMGNW